MANSMWLKLVLFSVPTIEVTIISICGIDMVAHDYG